MKSLFSKKNMKLAGLFGLGMVAGSVLYIKDKGLLMDGKYANTMESIANAV